MEHIHRWWEQRQVERFWLGIVRKHHDADVLATPSESDLGIPAWRRRLIMYIKPGDVVFHFDPVQQAIVAWSVSRGRVKDCTMPWAGTTAGAAPAQDATRMLATWSMPLDSRVALDEVVPLDAIARTQRELFPSLRALEDDVGEPLYYPFAIDGSARTKLLAGYVFKLPSVFVEGFDALVTAAGKQAWFTTAGAAVAGATVRAPRPAPMAPRTAPVGAHASAHAAR